MTSVVANAGADAQRKWTDSTKAMAITGGVMFAANAVPFTALAVLQQAPGKSIGIQLTKSAFHAVPLALAAGLIDYSTHQQISGGKTPHHLLAQDIGIGAAASVAGSVLLKNNGLVAFEKGNSRLVGAAIVGAVAGSLMYHFEPKSAK